jgi:hypothetical protein
LIYADDITIIEEYDDVRLGANIFTDDFTSEAQSTWKETDNSAYKAYFDGNGHYVIEPQTSIRLRDEVNIDNSRDFQIEMSFAVQGFISDYKYHGFGFGSSEGFYFITLASLSNEVSIYSGIFLNNAYHDDFNQPYIQSQVYENYTIRKIGSKVKFYFNHQFLYESDNIITDFDRYMFVMPQQSQILVNKVSIDYITAK